MRAILAEELDLHRGETLVGVTAIVVRSGITDLPVIGGDVERPPDARRGR